MNNNRFKALIALGVLPILLAGCARSTRTASPHGRSEAQSKTAERKKPRPVKAEDLSAFIRQVMKRTEAARPETPGSHPRAGLLENDPAVSDRQRALHADPQNIAVRMELAALYLRYGVYDAALLEYRKVQALAPDNPYLYESLARLWRAWGSPAAARTDLQKAIALKPDFADAYNSLGMVADTLGEYREAEAAYRSALSLDPKLDYVHNNLCYNLILQQKLDQALAQCEVALQLNPSSVTAHNNRGFILAMRGAYAEALEAFARATDPAGAHNNLGLVYLEKRMYSEALAEFRMAGQLRPAYQKAGENYELALHLRAGPLTESTGLFSWPPRETAQAPPVTAAATVNPAAVPSPHSEAMSAAAKESAPASVSTPPPAIIAQIVDFSPSGEAVASYLRPSALMSIEGPTSPGPGTMSAPSLAPLQRIDSLSSKSSLPEARLPILGSSRPVHQMIVFPSGPEATSPPISNLLSPVTFTELKPVLSSRLDFPVTPIIQTAPTAAVLASPAARPWARLRSFSRALAELTAPPLAIAPPPPHSASLLQGAEPAAPARRFSHLWPSLQSLGPIAPPALTGGVEPALPAYPAAAAPLAYRADAALAYRAAEPNEGLTFDKIFSLPGAGPFPASSLALSSTAVAHVKRPPVSSPAPAAFPTPVAQALPAAWVMVTAPASLPGTSRIDFFLPLLMVAVSLLALLAGSLIPQRRPSRYSR